MDPDASIAALDAVTFEQVREVAAGISTEYSVVCVYLPTPPRSSSLRKRLGLFAAACLAAALISACGATHAQRTTSTFSNLARAAPSRLASHATGGGTTTSSGGAPLTGGESVGLQRQIGRALAHSGAHVGLLVEDLSSGQVLDSRAATVPRPPASVEKLYTTVAAVDLLGREDAPADYRTRHRGLAAGGVWHGNLYLHGGGDPTFGDGTGTGL